MRPHAGRQRGFAIMKTELFVWVAVLAITISSPLSAVAEDETSYQAPLLLEVQPAGAPKL